MLNFRRLHLAVLAVAGLYLSSAASQGVEPRLLPANTEIVVTINIKQMLNSPLVKSNEEAVKQIKTVLEGQALGDAMQYLKQAGFEPFDHLTSITIAHPGTVDPKDAFIVVDGTFDSKKFAAAAASAAKDHPGSLKISKFGTTPVYEIDIDGKTGFLALVGGKSLVVAGQVEVLQEAIKRANGTTIVATKVKDLLKTTNDKQSVSVVVTGEALGRGMDAAKGFGIPVPDKVGDALANIQGISGAVTLTKDINFQLGIGTKDEKTAKDFAAQGKLLVELLKVVVAQQIANEADAATVTEALKTLRLTSVGSNIVLTGSVTQDNLQKILKMAGKNFKGGF